ncbi:MAG: SufD family Fe-S cluster assembly protein [Lachnospiraceae bacterium]|nr:SufD family Fe-S cluster assembly protein [Lachnospiraceae bacterium]
MDIQINKIPSPTWNWLQMNEVKVENVQTYNKQNGETYITKTETPDAVNHTVEDEFDVDVATGMGNEVANILGDATVHTFATEEVENEPVVIEYKFPQGVSASKVQLKVSSNAEMIVVQDFASDISEQESGDAADNNEINKSEAAVETRYDIAAGGHLTLIQIQHLQKGMRFYNNIGGNQEAEGGFTLIQLVVGGDESYYGCFAGLQGHKSTFENRIAYLLSGTDKLDMNYDIDHTGTKTVSDVLVSGVMRDASKKLFRGTIDFHRGCAGAKGSELEDVLLMDEAVRNQTIPVILCDEEDVEGSHGASIGKLDEKMMFYMKSRGIPEEGIYEMMAKAKIDSIVNEIPLESVRRYIKDLL